MQNITTGTEKQNNFAEDIRAQVVATMDEDLAVHGYTAADMIERNPEVAAIMSIDDYRF